ncbi:MAG: epoxyqueuosine reductase [Methanobrevibacter sp.]|nr:epoxyqueuosine reductase [Methanobrevibacter sp.]
MFDGDVLKQYLISQGISKVGYTQVNVDEFSSLNYGIALVLKLPREAIQALIDDEFKKYWKIFHGQIDTLTDIAFKGEKLIKDNGYDAFALTMKRNECDMEKLLSKLPYKTLATTSGLGWVGRSALFVCEEYGSAVALSGILTDMPLEVGRAITDSFCDDCEECQKACPVDAINPTKWNSRLERSDIIDIETCSEYVIDQFKSGLGCSKCLSNCRLTQEYFKNKR